MVSIGTTEETGTKLFYTLSEVCELTRMSHPRVHQLAKDGFIEKVIPPGNKRRGVYTLSSVDSFVAQLRAFHEKLPA